MVVVPIKQMGEDIFKTFSGVEAKKITTDVERGTYHKNVSAFTIYLDRFIQGLCGSIEKLHKYDVVNTSD